MADVAGSLEDEAVQRKARLKALRVKKAGQEAADVRCVCEGRKFNEFGGDLYR